MARSIVLVLLAVVGWAFDGWGQERRGFTAPTVGWAFLDLSDLNAALHAQGYPRLTENLLFLWGIDTTVIPPRVFGEWSFRISHWQGMVTAKTNDKLTKLVLSRSAGTVEYPLPTMAQDFVKLLAHLSLGVGEASLTVLDHRPASFDEALRKPASGFFTRSFFTVSAGLSVSFPLPEFSRAEKEKSSSFSLKLSASYTLTFDNGAWDQEGRALKGPPDNFNGWILRLVLEM
ncbi:MAG: hypothetical protein NZV61_00015 [Candidatus Bipolaricaulota bacterium]|nr:hypothetical protein [Candidatus Bipolaricaulota bacterium]MDW8141189.1 hypothetical protein [Candidatus Bipolaricaulota bacterium]